MYPYPNPNPKPNPVPEHVARVVEHVPARDADLVRARVRVRVRVRVSVSVRVRVRVRARDADGAQRGRRGDRIHHPIVVGDRYGAHCPRYKAGLARVSGRSIFSLLGWGSSRVRRTRKHGEEGRGQRRVEGDERAGEEDVVLAAARAWLG